MVQIRRMQASDQEGLLALFPEKPNDQYENYYIEHLTDKRLVLLAYDKLEDEPMLIYGYVTLVWESHYDHFWRRRIPEIVDLNVLKPYRNQGIGRLLIQACEKAAKAKNYEKIGISVVLDDPDYAAARHLYPKVGYVEDGFGITAHDNELHLWKNL